MIRKASELLEPRSFLVGLIAPAEFKGVQGLGIMEFRAGGLGFRIQGLGLRGLGF